MRHSNQWHLHNIGSQDLIFELQTCNIVVLFIYLYETRPIGQKSSNIMNLPVTSNQQYWIKGSIPFLEHIALGAISALGTNRTHYHLWPTKYSFTSESSEAFEGKVSCQRTQHRNNVSILRGGKT